MANNNGSSVARGFGAVFGGCLGLIVIVVLGAIVLGVIGGLAPRTGSPATSRMVSENAKDFVELTMISAQAESYGGMSARVSIENKSKRDLRYVSLFCECFVGSTRYDEARGFFSNVRGGQTVSDRVVCLSEVPDGARIRCEVADASF